MRRWTRVGTLIEPNTRRDIEQPVWFLRKGQISPFRNHCEYIRHDVHTIWAQVLDKTGSATPSFAYRL
ncbi:hypothetical protein M3J09_005004 [Ascochyta lentis]